MVTLGCVVSWISDSMTLSTSLALSILVSLFETSETENSA